MFTQKCFIRKNTSELVQKLEELGYEIPFVVEYGNGDTILAKYGVLCNIRSIPNSIFGENYFNSLTHSSIDCGTNEELFLAIASLRDDSDIHQWFIHDDSDWHNDQNIFWHKCESESIKIDMAFNIMYSDCRKATVEELIEHFNK